MATWYPHHLARLQRVLELLPPPSDLQHPAEEEPTPSQEINCTTDIQEAEFTVPSAKPLTNQTAEAFYGECAWSKDSIESEVIEVEEPDRADPFENPTATNLIDEELDSQIENQQTARTFLAEVNWSGTDKVQSNPVEQPQAETISASSFLSGAAWLTSENLETEEPLAEEPLTSVANEVAAEIDIPVEAKEFFQGVPWGEPMSETESLIEPTKEPQETSPISAEPIELEESPNPVSDSPYSEEELVPADNPSRLFFAQANWAHRSASQSNSTTDLPADSLPEAQPEFQEETSHNPPEEPAQPIARPQPVISSEKRYPQPEDFGEPKHRITIEIPPREAAKSEILDRPSSDKNILQAGLSSARATSRKFLRLFRKPKP
ncbi:MAG: hypothetical protein AAFX93_18325 [Verrucomicrobiota bacterium]